VDKGLKINRILQPLFPDSQLLSGVNYMGSALKHYLNPLHIYCRMRDLGFTKDRAVIICRFYEKTFFKLLLVRKNQMVTYY